MNRFAQRSATSVLAQWVPYIILLVTLLLTVVAALFIGQMTRAKDQLRFDTQIQQTEDSIHARLDLYISMLRGVSSTFAADPQLTRDEFRAYVTQLMLDEHYPGVQGVGFSVKVPNDQLDRFVQTVRQEGLPEFRIWPAYTRDEYHSILYLEPLDRRNREALGFDMFSENIRRTAMERARDTGQPAASGRVTLVQEIDEDKQAGFLIYVPIYRGGTTPPTVAERRANLIGFAYSPFRANDLLQGIFGSQTSPLIAFELYDGPPTASSILHTSSKVATTSNQPQFTSTRTLTIAEHEWTLIATTQPAFDDFSTRLLVPIVLLIGTTISVVLFALSHAQAVAQAQAEQAVRVRDVFLSVASHELKTPLTVLLGNVQLLQRRARRLNNLPERDQRSLDVMYDQSKRLNRLIETLLDNTRIQAGRFAITRKPLDLNALAHRVVGEIRPMLSNHTLTLNAPSKPITVIGDEQRLEQVLQNLINNAIKYSPTGGPIAVELGLDENTVTIRINDRGIGIPARALPHLFKQFYRAPNIDAQNISGLGIGLYLINEIVSLHGGTVSVESREGVGSTFTITLPTAPQADSILNITAERAEINQ